MGELSHYGVKGMHWGVRKSHDDSPHPDYNRSMQRYDEKNHGKGGVKRINRRLNKGQDLKTARANEYKFNRRRTRAITATATFGVKYRKQIQAGLQVTKYTLGLVAGVAAQHIAVKAETNRGRAAAAEAMGLPRHATDGPTYSKQKRGVYNITSI